MELYVTVSFWLGVVCLVANTITMCIGEFPINRSVSVGEKFISTLVGAGFVAWSGMLLF